MGSIKVWWGEGCRPRLAVEDVLISLPTLRLSRKEGGKKWGTPGAYFYISGIRNWLRQVSGEMSRDRGKGWRHHSGSFLNLRDKAGAITNAFSWPLIDDHPPLVLSLSKSADCCPLFCISFVNLNKWKESCVPRTKRECYKGWIIGPAPSDQLLLLIIYWSGIDN